ncbi:hypothetical protein [Polaromonas sp. CG9_12]|nr:hypothetical protein [Polaromonas sp. CG9_12]
MELIGLIEALSFQFGLEMIPRKKREWESSLLNACYNMLSQI